MPIHEPLHRNVQRSKERIDQLPWAIYCLSLLFLAGVFLISVFYPELGYVNLYRDPLAIFKASSLTGIVSNVGILVWSVGAISCLFCYFALSEKGYSNIAVRFALWSGLLTSLLLLDDFFMLHEQVLPAFGIPEGLVYLFYLLLLCLYLKSFLGTIVQQKSLDLMLALLFFASSLSLDIVPMPWKGVAAILEDSFKFLGIVSWSGFFFQFNLKQLQSILPEPTAGLSRE